VVLTNGQNEGFEGCASVSDANGTLLFYTNSAKVWNADNEVMPNGEFNPSNNSLSQVLIVQVPGSTTQYLIVTTTIQADSPGQLIYHVVDMSLDGGLGDVVSTNNPMHPGLSTENVSATRHANGTDVWVMAHDYPSNAFLAYLLTSSGLSSAPVVSNVGPAFAPCGSNMNARGEMKFSVDGARLAIAGNGTGNGFGPSADSTNMLALFHFDNATGEVSDPLELPYGRGDFGLSFSPDGSKLYGATWKAFNFTSADTNAIYQFDLSSDDPATIIASRYMVYATAIDEPFGSLKLAPDGHIYVARSGAGYLGVIRTPDLAGAACNYEHDGLYLNGATSRFGLNNYIEYVGCGTINVSLPETDGSGLEVFPDPARDAITIRGIDPAMKWLALMDAAGRIIRRLPSANTVLDLSSLAPGSYHIALMDSDGGTHMRRSFVRVP
jgi:hypothetical protein